MENHKKEDLRVIKTRNAIQSTFKQMICEMDYDQITVQELADRALINRKTFYLHYDSLDDLLAELQREIAGNFIQREVSYRSLNDIKAIIREFFEYAASMPELNERLLCSGSYAQVGDRINAMVMEHRAKTNKGAFSDNPCIDNLAFAYFSANSPILYRKWVLDGKKLPLEELIETATQLICGGLSAFIEKKNCNEEADGRPGRARQAGLQIR